MLRLYIESVPVNDCICYANGNKVLDMLLLTITHHEVSMDNKLGTEVIGTNIYIRLYSACSRDIPNMLFV